MATVLTLLAPGGCNTARCDERVAGHRCDRGAVGACIHRAAMRWRVSEPMLRRKAWCESRFRPWASNGTHFGLFQFLPSTFASTPYRRHSIWSAKYNSLAAAWMHRVGRGNEWACR